LLCPSAAPARAGTNGSPGASCKGELSAWFCRYVGVQTTSRGAGAGRGTEVPRGRGSVIGSTRSGRSQPLLVSRGICSHARPSLVSQLNLVEKNTLHRLRSY